MTAISHDAAAEVAACLKVLSDRTRLLMLKVMSEKPYCVCQLVEMFGMSQPAISQHIAKLKQLQLLSESRQGQWRFYTLDQTSTHYDLVKYVLTQIPIDDKVLRGAKSKGQAVACETNELPQFLSGGGEGS